MKNNKNSYFDWSNMQSKAQDVLGEDFWGEINRVMPKRGPCIDVYKTEDEVVVVVEIPGIISSENINVRLKGFKMVVSGEIPWTYPVSQDDMLQRERFTGSFKREINLPHDIVPGGSIDAQIRNGLIEIHIPRVPNQEEMEIPVEFKE
jgi:HSP20 family protein